MTNAFDIPKTSTLGKKLQQHENHRKSMTKWVEEKRKKNVDPGRLDINLNPKLPSEVLTRGYK